MTRGSHSSVSHRKSSCERRPLSQEGFPIVSPGQGELRQASRAAAQGARNPTRWGGRSCCAVRQESPRWRQETLLRVTGDVALDDRRRCCGRQELLRRAAGAHASGGKTHPSCGSAGDVAAGGRSRCAGQQESGKPTRPACTGEGRPGSRRRYPRAAGAPTHGGRVAIAVCRAAGGAAAGGTTAPGGRSCCAW